MSNLRLFHVEVLFTLKISNLKLSETTFDFTNPLYILLRMHSELGLSE